MHDGHAHARSPWDHLAVERNHQHLVLNDGDGTVPARLLVKVVGPREARPAKCEGPGCASALGDAPWTVDAEADGEAELHSFCSGECARLWQESDARLWQESRGAS